jgi:Secretion system C-terminal sorting domain
MGFMHVKETDLSVNRHLRFHPDIIKLIYSSLLMIAFYTAEAQSVIMQHNDMKRTGWDAGETTLTQANVSGGTFGKLFQITVDDQIYSQPLIVNNVLIGGGTHNIVIVTTVNNSVYAFDADDSTKKTTPYWHVNLTFDPPTYRPIQNSDMCNSSTDGACGGQGAYQDFAGRMGIVGTPAIDVTNGIIYVVARSVAGVPAGNCGQSGTYVQYLHALNLVDGSDKVSPELIAASITTINNITTSFDPRLNNQRPALLLLSGVVYIAWSSHCDYGNYHGWLLGYDAANLSLKYAYNTTEEGSQAGIWMSGQGPAVDDAGNLYISAGNGTTGSVNAAYNPPGDPNDPNYPVNRGESVVKLSPGLKQLDFFTPYEYDNLNSADIDYGVDGVLLIPNTNLSLSGSKEGYMYLVNTNTGYMGQTASLPTSPPNALQVLDVNAEFNGYEKHIHGSPVYFMDDKGNEYTYAWAEDGFLKQFPLLRTTADSSKFDLPNVIAGNTALPPGMPGAMLSVTSNGTMAGTGILWTSHPIQGDANHNNVPGILQVFDATNVSHELWNSNLNGLRDSLGTFAKFVPPTIANGKLYMATFSNNLKVYGLNAPDLNPCQPPTSPTLPTVWTTCGDIGYLLSPGYVCYSTPNNGTYAVTSGGADIWGTADAFHSVFQVVSGNGLEIIAHVNSLPVTGVNPNGDAKAGIMFRSNLDPGSANVFLALDPPLSGGAFTLSSRMAQNGATTGANVTGSSGNWLKLTANNNVYTGFASTDGINWVQLGSTITVNLGTNIYAGLAYTTHDPNTTATAVFDNVSVINNSNPLPVTLIDFTASNKNNQYCLLNWQTSAEINFDHFEIEHSTPTSTFTSIGVVAGHNNTSTNQLYSFTDNNPTDGDNYYRLKMVDQDGKFAYSKVVKVNFDLSIISVFPNPAKDRIYLKNNINFTNGEQITFEMFNTLGQQVVNRSLNTNGQDLITVNFPPGISSGIYYLIATNSDGKKQHWKISVKN